MAMTYKLLLHQVARLYKIQTTYTDAFGRFVESPSEAIARVLNMLGVPAEKTEDLRDALRQRRQAFWQRYIDPVLIAWDEMPVTFKMRLPMNLADTPVKYEIILDNGELITGECLNSNTPCAAREIDGIQYVTRRLTLLKNLPLGYHRLQLQAGPVFCEAHLLSSLTHTYVPTGRRNRWGLFCPLYALTSHKSWGAGDFSDLGAMLEFTAMSGGNVLGTLPLLAAFLDEPFNPSPYAPVSRRFWNEFYLDVTRIAEFQRCPTARAITESSAFQNQLQDLQAARFVDYRRLMAVKRRILEELLNFFLSNDSPRRAGLQHFIRTHPLVEDYASFRAKVERERKVWQLWPAANRDGIVSSGEFDERAKQYHLYAQWQCHEQMEELAAKARTAGAKLYLDFPLSVNRDGYDVWREPSVFALDAGGGAPPDAFFSKGQNWGFPPPHPDGLRQQGYRHYAECIRHHMQAAGMLRIDHILGLHRLYWIPNGFAASEGVYVHYFAEELYAVLSLESHRHRVEIIGENLGTVPPYANAAMAQHKVLGMHVAQFSVRADSDHALEEVPENTVASLNTHDTPTFIGFWNGTDIQDRIDLGLLEPTQSTAEHEQRATQKKSLIEFLSARGLLRNVEPEPAEVLRGWVCYLANQAADIVLVNLEDLLLEPLPQNVPGTWQERPNWQRKAPLLVESITRDTIVTDLLSALNRIRQARKESES